VLSKTTPLGEGPWDGGASCGHIFPVLTAIAVWRFSRFWEILEYPQRSQKSQRREEERRSRKRKFQKKGDPGARKGRKVGTHCVFPLICGSGGSKKHTMVGPLLKVQMWKKCTLLWREAHFEVKSVKNRRSWTTFGSCDVEKVHVLVARSTFPSQNVQNTP